MSEFMGEGAFEGEPVECFVERDGACLAFESWAEWMLARCVAGHSQCASTFDYHEYLARKENERLYYESLDPKEDKDDAKADWKYQFGD